jgi:hypothetical protein
VRAFFRQIRKEIRIRSNENRSWRSAPYRGTRFHRIEQRPVALLERVALGEWRPQFQPERTQHAVVAVVALQNNSYECCGGYATIRAKLLRHRFAPCSVKLGKRPAGEAGQMIERLNNLLGIAA